MISFSARIKGYQLYNRGRKIKAIHFDSKTAAFFFKVVPYLLHTNSPNLPGYIEDPDCPCGIHHFQPDIILDASLLAYYFPEATASTFQSKMLNSAAPAIHSLKTIGSIGSIAQTKKSDCDYWVSIRHSELGEKGMEMLEEKCKLIEEWSLNQGVEIYFFLMDIDHTRDNSFESVAEEESAGSALKLLLKDELFRTHILVAGKMLLWWLIPPGLTGSHEQFVSRLLGSGKINPDHFIDLGSVTEIPKEEIFGACLWQMNKALDSPFKSVIKFAYLELLLRQKSDLPILSNKIKSLVTFPDQLSGPKEMIKPAEIDPYLLLARDIVTFYRQDDTLHKEEKFIRQCLFLKTIAGTKQKKYPTMTGSMALMKQWDLLPANHADLTHFHSWNYSHLLKLGEKIHAYLGETYNRLRLILQTLTDETKVTITERDISILGRKLATFYQKKPQKIEYIRSISREIMVRDHLTFHIEFPADKMICSVYQGKHDLISIKPNKNLLIQTNSNFLDLMSWLLANSIFDQNTTFHMTLNYPPIQRSDIEGLAKELLKTFPRMNFSHISANELLEEERITQALVVVNFFKKSVKGTQQLQSTIVRVNSYGEYFTYHYETFLQLKNATRRLLSKHLVSRFYQNLDVYIPPQPEQYHIRTMIER